MKDSKPIFGIHDGEDFLAMVWETDLGKVVTMQGKINPQMNLMIKDCETGEYVDEVDLRNVLMQILPYKLEKEVNFSPELQTCDNCLHSQVSLADEPCKTCYIDITPYASWVPAVDYYRVEVEPTCGNCLYRDEPIGFDPCNKCYEHSDWKDAHDLIGTTTTNVPEGEGAYVFMGRGLFGDAFVDERTKSWYKKGTEVD
jgi:hypothetical protein